MAREVNSDLQKGAQETERPTELSQNNLNYQLPLRTKSILIQETENDFPEPGSSPEHSGQSDSRKTA
jgi:hypothetical protein